MNDMLELRPAEKNRGLARMIVFAASLLLASCASAAGGAGHLAAVSGGQFQANHHGTIAVDSTGIHHKVPAESPTHCHEQSPAPMASATLQQPVSEGMSTDTAFAPLQSGPGYNRRALFSATIRASGQPGYILFGNFRS